MITILSYIALSLIPGIVVFGLRAYRNYQEIKCLEQNGYRKVAARRLSNRGHVDYGFLRGLAEFFFLLLMLSAVLGWLTHSTPQ